MSEFSASAVKHALPNFRKLFPVDRLGRLDQVIIGLALIASFTFFYHIDIAIIGHQSLNYLFGAPLEFYDNSPRNFMYAVYPPTAYIVCALWLYPLKLLGLLKDASTFPQYAVYWLKGLTTLIYFASALLFHRISLRMGLTANSARQATAAWLMMPLAAFSQFIFSQCDIFYVALTLSGVLLFLNKRLLAGAACFGFAVTCKYFPAFVFFPLLLLNEKRFERLIFCCAIFALPTMLVYLLYRHSPGFTAGVLEYPVLDRIFTATLGLSGYWTLYLLPTIFAVLCGLSFVTQANKETVLFYTVYLWLISSLLPFVFITWHPQWVMFFSPPIVLTSMMSRQWENFFTLDLAAMFFFIAAVSIGFQSNVDTAMFHGEWLGLSAGNAYLMADFFSWFGDRSGDLFYSCFVAYFIIQIISKWDVIAFTTATSASLHINYGPIRRNLYVGITIFMLPASLALYLDSRGVATSIQNFDAAKSYGELTSGRRFEQTFRGSGGTIRRLSLLLRASSDVSNDVLVEILDDHGTTLARTLKHVSNMYGVAMSDIVVGRVQTRRRAEYKIRLTSPGGVTWFASDRDLYTGGEAIVDGIPQKSDFVFRITFSQ